VIQGAAVNNQWFSKVAVWLVIALVLFTVFKQFDRGVTQGQPDRYSEFLEEVRSQAHQVGHVAGKPGRHRDHRPDHDDKRLRSTATYLDRGLVGDLINNGVKFDVKPREEPSLLMSILLSAGARCCC
jgi:cell division protease FtsH